MDCIRRKPPRLGSMLCCSLGLALLAGCGDDTVTGVSMSGSGSGGTGGTTDIVPGTISADDTAGTADGTAGTVDGTGSDTATTDDTGDTGEPVDPGHAGGAWVNAGSHVLASPAFRLSFTFGQSSENQNTMTSPGYRLRGGLVPATE